MLNFVCTVMVLSVLRNKSGQTVKIIQVQKL